MPEINNEERILEEGRKFFAGECTFILGAAALTQVPDSDLPEIAFAGRSNVGKSSLVNGLTGRKTLARTSVTPGRTQQLNFFNVGERLLLADLPGYGYARAPKTEVDAWTRLVKSYLMGRSQLRRVCMLVDSRHGLKKNDREVMKDLDEAAVSYQIVMTKADKVKPAELARTVEAVSVEAATHAAAFPEIAVTSSHKGTGLAELRAALAQLAD
ncbi:MAG: YihA family ribosome biogenesis GTP-binding protein [Rhodospirillaceae bacterium]|jgi:GTP-binding protein|nr:YihA family ribosome biogenesis GTP-binding protein [Rhodospirillaceae bacterium]MBT5566025.1 YihA family ribosome biogenesis GTP-binding protein [Rhodospirillaceae bacterium]MBT6089021.1 YihA family ribosome biogenesis GTP-binding protein [Rhodospirillaceae bacterium]MBT6960675.1 YihA family ribosome biogenesis GTP-binding protein [Rhodospirillaceae bacterium]MBT7449882.1 YihA family ribosome biogenesis GTP-binding protein [Rhodospirillaceae bacterium]